jgi:hypothetical protein
MNGASLTQEESGRETGELQRRTNALDAERRTIDGSTDRFLVAEYNARAVLKPSAKKRPQWSQTNTSPRRRT